MSAERNPEVIHETADQAAPALGDTVMKKVVIRDHSGTEISSLDTNHDNIVGMREMTPPRPENSHDLAVAGMAAAGMALATVVAVGVQHLRTRR
jgi:hypothetical protein